ncbi:MAG: hypothetical protein EHM86_00295 [Desulfobulbaceae bacterium]|nr:MAG: hypothetical protein EHM86_00295 [Desulfobulbaceae bacterium]
MEQYTEKQYDDDLTVVADEYNDSFQTDNVDLFEFPSYDESPIARLKSLVLSIDWEITDEVLRQFNEELLDLKDIWANEKIYLVYVQALEKISKYIYQEKADSNPNAIKLLLTFYYNLEKIISSENMSEEEKKQILLEDVQKFEKLKQQIGRVAKVEKTKSADARIDDTKVAFEVSKGTATNDILLDLKAIVLGIDWEITEKDLAKLRDEVIRLEGVFAGSRPKLIFLQGIGTLGAYIRLKKSNAHADAFKLLHSFFAGLEKIVNTPMSLEEEKAILFPEVEKFNAFKAIVGSTISPEVVKEEQEEEVGGDDGDDDEYEERGGGISPAFSDLPEGEIRGFQEEEEAAALGLPSAGTVASQIDMFFSEEPAVDQLFVEPVSPATLQMRDEREEFRDAAEAHLDSLFQTEELDEVMPATLFVDQEVALRGVDVETEADDDSEEEDLPLQAGKLAPALADLSDENAREIKTFDSSEQPGKLAEDLDNRLDDLFVGEKPAALVETSELAFSDEELAEISSETEEIPAVQESPAIVTEALQGVDVETEDDEEEEGVLAFDEGDLAPALFDQPIAGAAWEEEATTDNDSAIAPAAFESVPSFAEGVDEETPAVAAIEEETETEVALEDQLESFFALDEDLEKQPVEHFEESFESQTPVAAFSEESVEGPIEELLTPVATIEEDLAEIDFATEPVDELAAQEVSEPALAVFAEEQPETEDVYEDVPAVALSSVTTGELIVSVQEIPEEEVVFELAEEEESFFVSEEPESLGLVEGGEQVTAFETEAPSVLLEPEPSQWQEVPTAEETEDVDFFAEAPEQEMELADTGLSESIADFDFETADIPAPALSSEAVLEEEQEKEFVAIFEGVDEDLEEDILPDQILEAEELLEITVPVPVEMEIDEEAEKFVESAALESLAFAELPSAEEEFVSVASEEPLSHLRVCVSSIGIELSDPIVQGLFREINRLRSKWVTRPLEKTFLQLLSTITQHIDQYRYESSSEAFVLLQSVMGRLAQSIESLDHRTSQELLLSETTKVLLWQQEMLNRQAVSKGDELTFADPVRFQAGEFVSEEAISFVEEEAGDEFAAASEGITDEGETLIGGAIEEEPEDAPFAPELAVFDATIEDESLGIAKEYAEMAAEISPEEERTLQFEQEESGLAEGLHRADDALFSDLEADLAAEHVGMTDAVEEPLSFDQQLKDLIQSEFALMREEWKSELATLRDEIQKRG